MKLIFTVLVVLISSLASEQELKCSSQGTQILYLNGVLNTWDDAKASSDRIIKILEKNHSSGKTNGIALVP